jgi:hypothetical protein
MKIKKDTKFDVTINKDELELLEQAVESFMHYVRSRNEDEKLEALQDIHLVIREALND